MGRGKQQERVEGVAKRLAELDERIVGAVDGGAGGVRAVCEALDIPWLEAERPQHFPEYERFATYAELVHWRLCVLARRRVVRQVPRHLSDQFYQWGR